jgi:hypothetical protein
VIGARLRDLQVRELNITQLTISLVNMLNGEFDGNMFRILVYTYPQGENTLYIDSIIKTGSNDTNGISYIHDNDGTFYSKINVALTDSYTIIIEQDLNSIPEFPSWIILPLFLVATLSGVLIRKLRRL